ncbi:unnamed protein product [Albugo candida]|uniref:Uncharacterized protein n=1 Tax=Albugo candida TaxID=65357 RepID=A0A024GI27_9STRA|nr:unnamed protein product [Albugo candida]|eukprot:CCI46181.1 unnamed protein product [Albugo candida]
MYVSSRREPSAALRFSARFRRRLRLEFPMYRLGRFEIKCIFSAAKSAALSVKPSASSNSSFKSSFNSTSISAGQKKWLIEIGSLAKFSIRNVRVAYRSDSLILNFFRCSV